MSGAVRIGSIGRLAPEKGFDILIEAARQWPCESVPIEVEIVGAGPLETELRAAAAGTPVRLLGTLPAGREIADFLRSLDIFVLSSRYREGRPNVLLEAIACGVPVVATDVPGVAEALAGGGRLVAPEDPAAIVEGVRATIDDRQSHDRALAAAARVASFPELAAAYTEVFELAVGRR